MSRVTVIGAGYVGLVTAGGLAGLGHQVCCLDIDVEKIERLRAGFIPVYEAGLDELIRTAQASGQLSFDTDHDPSAPAEFFFLCVPTPEAADGSADVSYLEDAVETLGVAVQPGSIVVNKSTVPVGSTTLVENILGRTDVHVVSNPEFLREGSAVHDFLHPDRIVIGADSADAAARVKQLYTAIDAPIVETDPVSAELIKYAANSFLATKLSFINAVASICEEVDADIADVRQGMGLDRRIGLDYFAPGPGWGGSCFPKDTGAMVRLAADAGYDFGLVRAAIETNERQLDRVRDRVLLALRRQEVPIDQAVVCMLGIAFKAGTDDTRQSPALAIAGRLADSGVRTITAYDPVAVAPPNVLVQRATTIESCTNADVVVVMTEWPEFADADLTGISSVMNGDTIIDTRGVIDPVQARRAGITLLQLGRSEA